MIDHYIRQYGKRLYGLCLSLCGNPFDADDLYQDTWLKVVRSFSQYDPSKPFEPWLTTICVNTYRNMLRRIARSPLMSSSHSEETASDLQAMPAPGDKDYLQLYEAIDRLPEKLRLSVILFYFEDMDVSSVAEVLGVPVGTVKSRLHKARKRLKEALVNEADLSF